MQRHNLSKKHAEDDMRSAILLFVLFTELTGCAAGGLGQKPIPTAQEIVNAYYGDTAKPDDYEKIVKDYWAKILKDPYSAVYVFDGPPGKAYVTYIDHSSYMSHWVTQYGYCGQVSINARNSYGGYVGVKQHGYLIRNNAVVIGLENLECVSVGDMNMK